jgi:hypothetical protein
VQSESIADVLVVNVREKIFVRCNAQCGRAAPPLNLERAAGFDLRKCADRALIGGDMAVASDADPVTAAAEKGQSREKCHCSPVHHNVVLVDEMNSLALLDSEK